MLLLRERQSVPMHFFWFYNKCWGLDLIKDKASGTYFLF